MDGKEATSVGARDMVRRMEGRSPCGGDADGADWVSGYRLRLAASEADVRHAQELRFMVFNVELREGLDSSYHTLRDADDFDAVCEHLLVEERANGEIVGTYRMQTGRTAGAGLGYYSAREFDFGPYEGLRDEVMELGRACVHRSHRNLRVLTMLWRGIVRHARTEGCRYLVGCSSLATQDAAEGWAVYRAMQGRHEVPEGLRTRPMPGWECGGGEGEGEGEGKDTGAKIPGLLRAYIAMGARVCGPPAVDREFGTIDFLTWMDLEAMDDGARRFLA